MQVMEATGKSYDEAAVALHDAEFDPEKAVIMLLEGENDQVNIIFYFFYFSHLCFVFPCS